MEHFCSEILHLISSNDWMISLCMYIYFFMLFNGLMYFFFNSAVSYFLTEILGLELCGS